MSRPAALVLDADQATALCGGTWIGERSSVDIRGAAIDSRQVQVGNVFACLAGNHVDGHDFAAAAVARGAVLILASRLVNVSVPVLLVEDVTAALGALATQARRQHRGRWLGVTGSNGKTTVKELIAAACAPLGLVHATKVNLNNHLGVPLTVLAAPAEAAVAVIEVGANHPGEIAALARIVQPQVAVITSIGPAHLEGFGTLAGVAAEKGALFAAVPAGGSVIFGATGLSEAARVLGEDVEPILAVLRRCAQGRRLNEIGGENQAILGELRPDGICLKTSAGAAVLP